MNFEAIIGILSIFLVGLLISVSYKGFLYDIYREDIDKNYKNNHSIRWRHGRLWFSIPRLILDNIQTKELQKRRKEYNRLSIIFWITIAAITIIYLTTGPY